MRIRAIKEISSTETDISVSIRDSDSSLATLPLTTTSYLYIGQAFPFNHLFFKFGTVNVIDSILKVEYWDGTYWRQAIDLFDETSLSGKTFGKDGFITFIPNKRYNWSNDDTIDQNGNVKITGIDTITVYEFYWIRLSVSANLTAGTTLNWLGNKFSDDTDLFKEYPVLNSSSFMTSFAVGKTTWEDQHIIGANEIIDDLTAKRIIYHPGQILDRIPFRMMSVPKVAEIIFNSLGDDYQNDAQKAYQLYLRRFSKDIFPIDQDNDARLGRQEQTTRQGQLYR